MNSLKLTLIILLILILKITTYAVTSSPTNARTDKATSQNTQHCLPLNQSPLLILKTIEHDLNTNCQITKKYLTENNELTDLVVQCRRNNRKLMINVNNNKIYFIDKVKPENSYLLECWVEGELSAQTCGLQITAKKCHKWDLSIGQ